MATKKKEASYAEMLERIETIVGQIADNTVDIDLLPAKIKEADELIAACEAKLTKADGEVEKLLPDKRETEE
ncbi:MAG: exodeoxyribonuclease VII small subunit [Prevotellaceae bacterium]|nr:exodeoxyribonuclease VII small subunit [Prevotellaceae bacterium]